MAGISRREWLAVSGALLASCGRTSSDSPPSPPGPTSLDLESLTDAIGRSRPRETGALVDRARAAGVPVRRVLAAAWLATLRWGGLREDVHAVLVLPSTERLVRAAHALGADAWLPVRFAVANAATWCTDARAAAPTPSSHATPDTLVSAIRAGEEDDAIRHTAALMTREGDGAVLRILCDEALEPREDMHAAIYAAQTARFIEAFPATHRSLVVAHLARYLARVPRWSRPIPAALLTSIDLGPNDAIGETTDLAWALAADPYATPRDRTAREICDALVLLAVHARVRDTTPSGLGCHRTTHLDAMIELTRSASPERVPFAIAAMIPSVLRGPDAITPAPPPAPARDARIAAARNLDRFRRDTAERIAKRAQDEHTIKYWAALDTLDAVVSPELRPDLWSGSAIV